MFRYRSTILRESTRTKEHKPIGELDLHPFVKKKKKTSLRMAFRCRQYDLCFNVCDWVHWLVDTVNVKIWKVWVTLSTGIMFAARGYYRTFFEVCWIVRWIFKGPIWSHYCNDASGPWAQLQSLGFPTHDHTSYTHRPLHHNKHNPLITILRMSNP